MREARPNKGGRVRKTGSFDGHGATISKIPPGAAGVWDVDERGRSIRPLDDRKEVNRRLGQTGNGNLRAEEKPPTPGQQALLDLLDPDEPQRAGELAEILGIKYDQAHDRLMALKTKGLADKAGKAWERAGWVKTGDAPVPSEPS